MQTSPLSTIEHNCCAPTPPLGPRTKDVLVIAPSIKCNSRLAVSEQIDKQIPIIGFRRSTFYPWALDQGLEGSGARNLLIRSDRRCPMMPFVGDGRSDVSRVPE